MNKNMKAGYQGKKDAMRDMAEKLMDHPGHAKAVYYSKSCADKEVMRPFKTGGHVKKDMPKEGEIVRHLKRDMREEAGEKYGNSKLLKHIEKKNPADKEALKHLKVGMQEAASESYDNKKLINKMEGDDKMNREYKKGGCAKPQKFATGGIGKVRHDQATMDGKQKNTKKVANTPVYY